MTNVDFFGLAFGSMIGIGWVISVPQWISSAGSLGAIIALLVTMAIVIPIGYVYAELTSSLKLAGGEFTYTAQSLGKTAGFLCGWFLILGYLIILPWVAISVPILFAYVFPFLNQIPLYTIIGETVYLPHILLSLAMIVGMTYINYKGAKLSARFQNTATFVMLFTFIAFLVGGFFFGDAQNATPLMQTNSEDSWVTGIVLAVASILFFMNGFDTISKTIDEADQGINYKNLGKVTLSTIIVGGGLYIIIVAASSFLMPAEQMGSMGSLPLIHALEYQTGSKLLPLIVVFGVLLGVITTFNGFLLAGSRLVRSFAAEGYLPKFFAKQHSRYKTPSYTLWTMAAIAFVGVLFGSGALLPLVIMGGISFLIAWFCMALSAVRVRQILPSLAKPYKMPGGITMAYIASLFSGVLLFAMLIPGTPISMGSVEYILFAVWLIIGALFYIFYTRNNVTQLHSLKKRSAS
ncbi:APC family permease [Geomicrobium sp. JSM 1781026]|uniref:APC family permease n=1 Tax=Geomicrobium sp. JSM 1781026 TaxID=3344580 RepID=UPI0035C08DC3